MLNRKNLYFYVIISILLACIIISIGIGILFNKTGICLLLGIGSGLLLSALITLRVLYYLTIYKEKEF
jgi:hypothetical protein